MLDAKDPVITSVTKILHLLSSDPETVRLAELRDKAIWDEVSRINGARAEGLEQGIQKGIEEGLQRGRQETLQRELNITSKMLAKLRQ